MIGKLKEINRIGESLNELVIETLSGDEVRVTVEKEYDNNYVGKYVATHTDVTLIANANFSYVYPPGTIGTF